MSGYRAFKAPKGVRFGRSCGRVSPSVTLLVAGSSSLGAWARRLLAVRAATSERESYPPPSAQVAQTLRVYLTRLVGRDGFAALQRRALILARLEIPSLLSVNVAPDGHLEGMDGLEGGDEATIAITAHVLELLIAFIGEPLTLRLMRDAFPDESGATIGGPEDP